MAESTSWTTDTVRQNARNWTLEGDAQLLELMQGISNNLGTKVQQTTRELNSMVSNLDRTAISLENTTNKLAALQHSQFVENRVYEDDETLANVNEVPVNIVGSDESKSYNPIETLNKILKNNLQMLQNCHDKVAIDLEDSDEEGDEQSKNVMYRSKNPYDERPLPHIFGSKDWNDKWHIGLCDSDEEFSGDEDREEYSESSDSIDSLPSNAPTVSESEGSVWGLHTSSQTARQRQYQSSEDDVTPINSSASTRRNSGHIFPPPIPDERYYVHKPKAHERSLFDESSSEEEQNVPQNPPPKPKENKISNIFNDEPPDFDEVDREENTEKDQLFYESEAETAKKVQQQVQQSSVSAVKKRTVNLFDDNDFDSFMKELDQKTNERKTAKLPVANLFNETPEDEVKVLPPVPQSSSQTSPFDDKQPVPVPQARKVPLPQQPVKTPVKAVKNIFDDESDEGEDSLLAQPAKSESSPVKRSSVAEDDLYASHKSSPKESNSHSFIKTKLTNLFDDEPPDDDFDSLFKSPSSVISPKAIGNATTRGLFDDEDGNEPFSADPTKAENVVKSATANIFKDDLFSSGTRSENKRTELKDDLFETPTQSRTPEKPKESTIHDDKEEIESEKSSKIDPKMSPKLPSLFEDEGSDWEEDLFKPTKKEQKVETNKGNSLFGESLSDKEDDLFGAAGGGERTPKSVSEESVQPNKGEHLGVSLEAKNEETEDDNTFQKAPSSKMNSSIKKPELGKLSSLFDDPPSDKEEEIFGNESQKPGSASVLFHEEDSNSIKENEAVSDNRKEVQSAETLVPNDNSGVKPKPVERKLPDDGDWLASSEIPSVAPEVVEISREKEVVLSSTKLPDLFEDLGSDNDEDALFGKATLVSSTSEMMDEQAVTVKNEKISEPHPPNVTLFSDEPPEDDFETFLSKPIREEVSPTIENSQANDKQSSALAFNPYGLFQDVPPPDDHGDEQSDQPKRIHNIFYDDFADTVVNVKSPSAYIYSDEPPDDEGATSQVLEEPDPKELEKPIMPTKQFSVADLIKKVAAPPDESEKQKTTAESPPVVNRLKKADFTINVAALMPGAKRPTSVASTSEPENVASKSEPEKVIVDVESTNTHVVQSRNESSSNPHTLENLTKTRAKIPVKRRPSTRKGRQEIYRKSMIEAESWDDAEKDQKSVSITSSESNDATLPLGAPAMEKEKKTTCPPPLPTVPAVTNAAFDGHQAQENVKELAKLLQPAKSYIFEDSDSDDLFGKSHKSKPQQPMESRETAKPSPTAAGLFGNNDSSRPQPKTLEVTKPQSVVKKSSTGGLFDSDDDDDDLFGSVVKKPAASKLPQKSTEPKKPPTSIKSKSRSLFDDVDEDDDDLFGTSSGIKTASKVPALNRIEKKTPPAPSNEQKASDNPLADLL